MTSSLPFTLRARQEAAMRLRLSEASGRRWLWVSQAPLGAGGPRDDSHSTVPLALVLMASGCFALGHRQGQEKAARDAVTWLRLDG